MYNVHSHPRSGTHYLLAVLNANFIHKPSMWEVDWGHLRERDGKTVMAYPLHGLPETFSDNALPHFYVRRDFEEIAQSILRMPRRFGIVRDDLTVEEFSSTPWGELYVPGTRWKWKLEPAALASGAIPSGNSTAFGAAKPPAEMTPRDYWEHHVTCWESFASGREDVCVVNYTALTSDFQEEMGRISAWLGEENREFVDVAEKVGGQPL